MSHFVSHYQTEQITGIRKLGRSAAADFVSDYDRGTLFHRYAEA